ncbi:MULTISPECIES: hypothetical protein [unclassified Variovorax]|uniref:hypothetical protein n=1 Tax=unclassified Variovorax TaxID=663243 RepID=UPI0008CDBC2D|nr:MULTISPECIES: hypothetical protein [unclassified Variovorax]SEK17174.1 hypothetical protein SAMN05518853_13713 [Variovorax sp. OK202]SFE74755.1 hypothetical protein SAMN05444746_13613 [Variovorax sp. OK212]
MTMNLLRQIAGSRLPVSFYRNEDIDGVRVLRAAGLVVALVPSPSDPLTLSGSHPAAQVLAVTQKGRDELAKFDFPESRPPRWRFRMPKIKTAIVGRHANASSTPREPARPH